MSSASLCSHALGWRLPQADLRPGRLPTDIFMCGTREEAPTDYHDVQRVPNRNPLQTQGLPISRSTTREVPHKQNYDQGGSPQAELKPGSLPGWLVGWLAGGITTREPVMRLAGWLAGWGAGWLAEAQRGSQRPREAQRGPGRPWVEQACRALGWRRRRMVRECSWNRPGMVLE